MSSDLDVLRQDLADEHAALDQLVAGLDVSGWATPTPAAGWDVTDQIGHLTFFDATATLAISDADAFSASVADLVAAAGGPGLDAYTLGAFRALDVPHRLSSWRDGRARLIAASHTLSDDQRVPWYGPSMGAKSFLTARLMETWAHGQDVADALGARREASNRLRHVARIGTITRGWSYSVHGLQPPEIPVLVELTGPNGETWRLAEGDTEFVRGSAEEFCLVVTQRRHLDDTALSVSTLGREWMLIAQAFAGGPTTGPAPKGE